MVYLDNSATTKVCNQAVERMVQVMTEQFGNPSSLHSLGISAEAELTKARREVAALVGAPPERVFFTGGGTEANNLAILGGAAAKQRRTHRAVTTAVEHSSVAACFDELEKQGWEVIRIKPSADGCITPAAVEAACTADTSLVSCMMVNNETGALTDMAEVVRRVRLRSPEALIHTDCVQAAGKLPLKAERMGVDLLTVSSHKLHGPKGCGALYIRKGARILPRQFGGGQEQGLRPGTEGLPAIAGFGAAAAAVPSPTAQKEQYARLRGCLQKGLSDLPEIRWHLPEGGVPYINNVSVIGFRSETLLHFLAQQGIYVSGGSACARGQKSHVLTAMGVPEEEIDSALRISFCFDNTEDDIQHLCAALHEAAAVLQKKGR